MGYVILNQRGESLFVEGGMKEISLCIMTRELCHQFFREHESDQAVYEDESQFRPYVYSGETAENFFKCKHVLEKAGVQFIDEKDGFKYYRFVR